MEIWVKFKNAIVVYDFIHLRFIHLIYTIYTFNLYCNLKIILIIVVKSQRNKNLNVI